MINTTLCYLEKNEKYLMLYRNKKKDDINEGKWIGIGGKFEPGESADECLVREVYEETGLKLNSYEYRGLIHFIPDNAEDEDMYLYTADKFTGDIMVCDEGELAWIDKKEIFNLNLWEGDKIFLKKLLNGESGFEISLFYVGDKCVRVETGRLSL
ncbi:MAG: 8-oxo-dGTP diphosphatase [Lachnospiraceae bacterium]|nr:8-oxo-dGTP diphosphatase [Lachnospiraceae bacterium]